MFEGKNKAQWKHTSSIIATLVNLNRDPKRQPTPLSADKFDPYATKQTKQQKKKNEGKDLALAKMLFEGLSKKQHGQNQ